MSEFYTFVKPRSNGYQLIGYRDGKKFHEQVDYEPRCWVPPMRGNEPISEYKTIYGKPLVEHQFENNRELKKFVSQFEGSGVELSYFRRQMYQFLIERYTESLPVDYSLIRVATIDIEAESESGFPNAEDPVEKINAISVGYAGEIVSFGLEAVDADPEGYKIETPFKYYAFKDEYTMLASFIKWFSEKEFDAITGWNVEFFDLPYLISRCNRILGEKITAKLSPVNRVEVFSVKGLGGKPRLKGEIEGVSTLDYVDLYKKFTYVRLPTYKLDYVAQYELEEGKLDDDDETPMHLRYKTDYTTFIHYNVKDVELVMKLDRKLQLLDLAEKLAYQSFVLFSDVLSQVRCWECYIAQYCYRNKIIVPYIERADDSDTEFEGAYVHQPSLGMKKWVVSFDLDSLYPNLLRTFNISPETIVRDPAEAKKVLEEADTDIAHMILDGKLGITPDRMANLKSVPLKKEQPYTIAFNNQLYRKDKPGIFPLIVKELYKKRKDAKNKMLDAKKLAEQIKRELKKRGELQHG